MKRNSLKISAKIFKFLAIFSAGPLEAIDSIDSPPISEPAQVSEFCVKSSLENLGILISVSRKPTNTSHISVTEIRAISCNR